MIYSNWLREKSHNAIKFGEAEGNPCVLKYSKGKKLKNYEIYGNSVQETRSGKNLLKNTATSQRINGVSFIVYPKGGISASGTNSSSTNDIVFDVGTFIPDKSSTYTFSGGNANGSETTFYLSVFLLNGEEIVHEEHMINANGLTIDMSTITEEFTVCKVSIVVKASGTISSRRDFYPMIELGTAKTDYEPYGAMPSPEYPSEIKSVGDLTTKNLFDKDKEKYKVFMHSDTIISKVNYYTIFIDVENISNFTISIKNGQKAYYGLCDSIEVGSEIYEHSYFSTTRPRIITNNTHKYLGISIWHTAISAFADVQIEEGDIVTEYEPYHKYKIPVEIIKSRNLIDLKDINSWTKQYLHNNYQYYQIRLHEIFPVNTTLTFHFEVTENIPPWLYMRTNDDDLPKNSDVTLYFTTNSVIRKSLTFTIKEGCFYILYPASTGISSTTTTLQTWLNKFEYMQIELGSTQSEYEPYSAEITNIYLNEPLRGIRNHNDYIDFRNKKVVRNIKEKVFNGSESWNFDRYKTKTAVYKTLDNQIGNVDGVSMSNRFMDSLDGDVSKIVVNHDNYIYVAIDKEYAPDKKSFKTWLANNPTYAIYSIATPIEEPIDNLPDIITNNNDCTIRLGSNIQPSNIKVKYIRL